jgi:phosphatidylglycerol---prolipoprotein diacylglyceryl transferase
MILLDPIIWQPNRYIFTFSENVQIAYYGFFYTLSFLLSIILIPQLARYNEVKKEDLVLLVIVLAIGAMVGGRLGYVIFYGGAIFLNEPIEILKTWKGGISSHGCAIGIMSALFIFKFYIKKPFLWLFDKALILALLAGSLIRMGNFFNSEKIGAETNADWGVIFKNNHFLTHVPRHPTQLYESFVCFLMFVTFLIYHKNSHKPNGYASSFILISLFGFRYLIGYFFSDSITDVEQSLNILFIVGGGVLFFLIVPKK